MPTQSFYMNKQEMLDFCSKHQCLYDEIPKVIKASITNQVHSKYFRQIGTLQDIPTNDKQQTLQREYLEDFIRNTEPAEFVLRRSELLSKPVFTPDIKQI